MDVIVKRFEDLSLTELYEIIRCRIEVFVVEQDIPYQDLDHIDNISTHVFIKNNNRIIAYLRVIDPRAECKDACIGRVLVMKEFRGNGLARRLMFKGIEVGKKLSDGIVLHAQTYLREFYESLGFVTTSDEYILEGRPHITMKLQ